MKDSTKTALIEADETPQQTFLEDVLEGLGGHPRSLPCKYFYDQRGSRLFDEICRLDEYYLTRTELEIMRRYAPEMGQQIGPGVMLVEYGSGSSNKTRLLLDHLPNPVAYVPVDISRGHLLGVATELQREYPQIEILPVAADFTCEFELPRPRRTPTHAAVYFPGSTIGNFQPQEAELLLIQIARLCGRGGGLLIGIDLDKNRQTLELAYNDPGGVTAEFNLNLLHRMRDELDADVGVDRFEHLAVYNPEFSRMEIFIRSLCDQTVIVAGRSFEISEGELIHTENSHKYTIDGFAALAATAGLTLRQSWTDDQELFAVLHLAVLD